MSKFEDSRSVLCWGFVGDNGSGKSLTARALALKWKSTRPGYHIAAYDPTNRFQGVADIFFGPDNVYEVLPKLRNTLVIFDEHRILHPADKVDKKFSSWFAMRRDWNIDIFYIVHNPSLIINFLTYFTNKYFIYYTQSKEGGFAKKIPNYTMCYKGSILINNYITKYGDKNYPNFPYVIIDKKENNITTINMPANKVKTLLK